MLPRLRFLLAAMLIGSSMLVFGMGAIALLRASHRQFASAPPTAPPEPVFAQAPATVPSLSMLTLPPPDEPVAPRQQDQEVASLTGAERADHPPPPIDPVVAADPPEPAQTRSEAPIATEPGAESVAAPQSQDVAGLSAPSAPADQPAPEPPRGDSGDNPSETAAITPAPSPAPELAARSDAAAETTGSIADAPPENTGSLTAAAPLRDPPVPQARPASFASPETVTEPKAAKPAAKRKKHQARRRLHERKVERLPAAPSAPTLGSLFGGSSWR
jgi:hypothetical protein